jgi:capsular polysaccharide export protein
LESLLQTGPDLRRDQLIRVEKLIARLIKNNISKYNLTGAQSDVPQGHRILVPGQVEDDASIQLGADKVRTNLDLLRSVRANHPDAVILYKPHPDVIAGLRKGHIDPKQALQFCDQILENDNISDVLAQIDAVHTITSHTGFEALLRGRNVTTYGTPFYAGWGLTTDLGKTPVRRQRQITVEELVHRTLIDYPRYWDPVTKSITAVEGIIHRLETDGLPRPAPLYRLLSKVQGIFASADPFWR